ncbi:hypothetical protein [Georgenia sp. SUBG003]|uniref:hypothetical protein n=1 Tax=Georgenia sp. SUBG003 TaxID=1497974 RepID=UPI003AB6404D
MLNLISKLRRERELTLIMISHDLRVVRFLCDRVAVMYLGQIVEVAESEALFTGAMHPYTIALLEAAAQHQHQLCRGNHEQRHDRATPPPSLQ